MAGESGANEEQRAAADPLVASAREIEALRAALDGLIADMRDFSRAYHEATHGNDVWQTCGRGVCGGMRRAIARAEEG